MRLLVTGGAGGIGAAIAARFDIGGRNKCVGKARPDHAARSLSI